MALILVKCPYCGEMVEVDENEKIGFCEKCQDDFLIKSSKEDELDDLEEIEENYYEDEKGNLVAKAEKQFVVDELGELTKFKGIEEKITIPEGIKRIGKYVFSGMDDLKEVVLPKSLEFIGECAFESCINLDKLVISENVLRIDNDAFDNCSNLAKVSFAKNCKLESIGESAFVRCNKIVDFEIPKSVVSIESNAFSQCKKLWNLTFEKGSNLKNLAENAFSKCENIMKVVLPASLEVIGKNGFFGCKMLKYISFEENSILKKIESLAFNNLPELESIIIPESIKEIGDAAFKECPKLSHIEFLEPSEIKTIGVGAFADCLGLKNIIIPRGVELIDANAFKNCPNLESVEISNSVLKIGDYAFSGCKALSNIDFQSGSSLQELGNYCFENCESIDFIKLNETKVSVIGEGAFSKCDKLEDFLVPKDVKILHTDTFRGCRSLSNISFLSSGNLERICENAFYWCNALTNIVIPKTVSVIEGHAFEGCVGIDIMKIPASVKDIGALGVCGNKIYIDHTNPTLDPNSVIATWPKNWFDNYKTKVFYKEFVVEEENSSEEETKPVEEEVILEEKKITPNDEVVKPISHQTDETKKIDFGENNFGEPKKKGCYVATCVYGSYDCPNVYVLRRYRDFCLQKDFFGRLFIRFYYFVSPKAVHLFGKTKWFNNFFKHRLDKKVNKLKNNGYSDTPYND